METKFKSKLLNLTEKQKNLLEMAIRYKFAYEELLEKLPEYKRSQLTSNDRFGFEFAREVAKSAES